MELSKCEPKTLGHAFEGWIGSASAVSFFCLIDAAQFHYCDAPGFLRRHPGTDVVIDMQLQIAFYRISKFAFASAL